MPLATLDHVIEGVMAVKFVYIEWQYRLINATLFFVE